jgi:hypothetical protein
MATATFTVESADPRKSNAFSPGFRPSVLAEELEEKAIRSMLRGALSARMVEFGLADAVFRTFIEELFDLQNDDEEDVPIAPQVLAEVLDATSESFVLLGGRWARPRVSTDDAGGVRLSWSVENRELRAVFPASVNRYGYLYRQDGNDHGTINNFTGATLSNQLRWLLNVR